MFSSFGYLSENPLAINKRKKANGGILIMNIPLSGWTAVGLGRAVLEKSARRAVVQSNDLAVWRGTDGKLRAWENRCPHRGMRLSYGIVRENRLTCLYHGWTYDGEGRCAAIPAHPGLEPPRTITANKYKCLEHAGMIWVASDETDTANPDFDGVWNGCRSLHLNRVDLTVQDVVKGLDGNVVSENDLTAIVKPSGQSEEVLVALQVMDENQSMLHASVREGASEGVLQAVSECLIELRARLEREPAAIKGGSNEH